MASIFGKNISCENIGMVDYGGNRNKIPESNAKSEIMCRE